MNIRMADSRADITGPTYIHQAPRVQWVGPDHPHPMLKSPYPRPRLPVINLETVRCHQGLKHTHNSIPYLRIGLCEERHLLGLAGLLFT